VSCGEVSGNEETDEAEDHAGPREAEWSHPEQVGREEGAGDRGPCETGERDDSESESKTDPKKGESRQC